MDGETHWSPEWVKEDEWKIDYEMMMHLVELKRNRPEIYKEYLSVLRDVTRLGMKPVRSLSD